MIAGALISSVLGNELPGPGTRYVSQQLRFVKPVQPGEQIQVRLTAKEKTPRNKQYGEVRWDAQLTNQDDEVVAQYDVLTLVAKTWPMAEQDEAAQA